MRILKNIFLIALGFFYCLSLDAQQESGHFYYYFGSKVFFQQRTDKIYLKFTQDTEEDQLRTLINSDVSLLPTSDVYLEKNPLRFAILETKEGNRIASATLESFRSRPEIVSATYLYQHNGICHGLTDEFVVRLKPATSYEQLQKLAEQNHCIIGKECQYLENRFMIYVSKASALNAMQTSNLFYETGLFEWSAPNLVVLNTADNGTFFGQQWGLRNIGQSGGTSGIDIRAQQAWTITQGSPNIRIAVIDDGVDLTHPDLEDNLLQGFDAVRNVIDGAPIRNNDNHGTPCAGIVGGRGIGISGVAPNSRIIPIRAYDRGNVSYDFLFAAINEAMLRGAGVITHSWSGGADHPDFTFAINNAINNGRGGLGVVFVNSSGNNSSSTVNYPASLPNVIAVGSINRNGQRASSSNHGVDLNVVAPGVDILSTDRQGNAGYTPGNDYTNFGGTSAAAPHVAGIAALILSVRPDLTAVQVRNTIESTCRKLLGYTYTNNPAVRPNGTWESNTGYGLVDAYAAVYSIAPRISGPDIIGINCEGNYTIDWSGLAAPTGLGTVQWSINKSTMKTENTGAYSCKVSKQTSGTGTIIGKLPILDLPSATLTATMLINGQNYTLNKKVQIGATPGIAGVWDAQTHLHMGTGVVSKNYYLVSSSSPTAIINSYTWKIPHLDSPFYSMYSGSVTQSFQFPGDGMFTIYLTINDDCGDKTTSISFYVAAFSPSPPYIVYPNPTSSTLYFEIDSSTTQQNNTQGQQGNCRVQMYSIMSGALVLDQKVANFSDNFNINVSSVPDGLYSLILLQGSEIVQQQTILIQH